MPQGQYTGQSCSDSTYHPFLALPPMDVALVAVHTREFPIFLHAIQVNVAARVRIAQVELDVAQIPLKVDTQRHVLAVGNYEGIF